MMGYVELGKMSRCDLTVDETEVDIEKTSLLKAIESVADEFCFTVSINRKVLNNVLFGITNNHRRLHGGFVIRQRAYEKNYRNKRRNKRVVCRL